MGVQQARTAYKGGAGGAGRSPPAAAWGATPSELSTPEAVEAQRRALEERMARLAAREAALTAKEERLEEDDEEEDEDDEYY